MFFIMFLFVDIANPQKHPACCEKSSMSASCNVGDEGFTGQAIVEPDDADTTAAIVRNEYKVATPATLSSQRGSNTL